MLKRRISLRKANIARSTVISDMNILKFELNDKLKLKKSHPCGSDTFTVMRLGTDVRIICDGCARDMTFDRTKLEKMIKKVLTVEDK